MSKFKPASAFDNNTPSASAPTTTAPVAPAPARAGTDMNPCPTNKFRTREAATLWLLREATEATADWREFMRPDDDEEGTPTPGI